MKITSFRTSEATSLIAIIERRLFVNFRWPWRSGITPNLTPENWPWFHRKPGFAISVYSVYDGKTLNDKDSIQKNWHNMVNDLATEATTVHARFPYAVVSFLVALPKDAAMAIPNQLENIITTLQRMNCRDEVNDEDFKAESIALVIWDPHTGEIDPSSPLPSSNLRVEKYTSKIEKTYVERYNGMTPHNS